MPEPEPRRLADGVRGAGFLRPDDFASTSGASAPEQPALLRPGERFAERLQIVSVLGQGGMGVVYRARDLELERDVALKVLMKGPRHAERWARFEREGAIAASLRHPGIVTLLSAGESGATPYLEYELVEEHRTLDQAFATLDLRSRADKVLEAAVALGHAHARGVVHRDVKPSNLLVDVRGRVRVTDFGLALAEGFERLTGSGHVVGTPVFMAPEQWQSDHAAIRPHTDVWALGAVLYVALTGRRPFEATNNPAALLAKILAGPPPAPTTVAPAVWPALEAVCLRALRRVPGERQADGTAFARDLSRALA